MNRGFLVMALFLAIGVGLYYYLQPAGAGSATNGATFEVLIEHRKMDPAVIKVAEGTPVVLELRTDEDGTVHVDDYETAVIVAQGRVVTMQIFANKSGSYAIHIHPETAPNQEIQIGTLEVVPERRGW